MINIGCNYILEGNNNKYDELYSYLIKKELINVLKFPGKLCSYEELNYCINLAKETKVKIDLHGLPNMEPKTNSEHMLEKVKWSNLTNDLIKNMYKNRISTHIGSEKDVTMEEANDILLNNIRLIKEKFWEKYSTKIEFGGENQCGGYGLARDIISPETISNIWGILDFGVFDISHAKLASKDLGITYEDYINKLANKKKVKILHISGNIDKENRYKDRLDKHFIMDESEIPDIIKTIKEFPNLDLIDTEYAFNSRYSFEKELVIEIITLNKIISTLDAKESTRIYRHISKNLQNDISNINKIIEEVL